MIIVRRVLPTRWEESAIKQVQFIFCCCRDDFIENGRDRHFAWLNELGGGSNWRAALPRSLFDAKNRFHLIMTLKILITSALTESLSASAALCLRLPKKNHYFCESHCENCFPITLQLRRAPRQSLKGKSTQIIENMFFCCIINVERSSINWAIARFVWSPRCKFWFHSPNDFSFGFVDWSFWTFLIWF